MSPTNVEHNTSTQLPVHKQRSWIKRMFSKKGLYAGVVLTLLIALLAGQLVALPLLSIMGVMILSILLGMGWKATFGVPTFATEGVQFSTKYLLRAGIILMGLRLNLEQIYAAGMTVLAVDLIVIVFTLVIMLYLGHKLAIDAHSSALIAVGTAVCGAAAIVAVAPLIGAKKAQTAIAVSYIAVLGTIGTMIYTFIYPFLGVTPDTYGLFVGATLHELAHVIAAAAPAGEVSSETAILVKLGRVALLIPVALFLAYWFERKEGAQHPHHRQDNQTLMHRFKNLPIPWFVIGFLLLSMINTLGVVPIGLTHFLIALSVLFLSMAMAGLGLSIHVREFKQIGLRTVSYGVLGYASLVILGVLLVNILSH
ncbi:YeiH family protein [Caldalkalibacillus salinus]|uniref:YeiH family protein n=1 Tax=Caldalkalibacillus salinus TaxID=2803787 RepID=UPI001924EBC7|nr:YeiH family protein [Caldalkalibacillus salinus]